VLRRFKRGDRKPGPDWFNAVADRLEGPPLEVDGSSGLTLTQLGRRWVLSLAVPIAVRPALSGGSGIPARSGATLGSAEVTLYALSGAGVLSATTRTVAAHNLAGSAVGASKYLLLLKVLGLWVVVWEECD
jgi:hypothetical protein